jgi:AbrB family looped-hinge helix DNA binding protein
MATPSVKVSNRYQIAMPQQARKRLKIKSGDRLLVDIQDGMLILMPEPKNYTAQMAGLHVKFGKNRGTILVKSVRTDSDKR